MARKRATSDQTLKEMLSGAKELFRELGKLGGPARAKKLTAEQRSAIAKKAAAARWKKK